jgi:catechol 2,3-dioxygenase-like lactoylglutathione lyase family enzyme
MPIANHINGLGGILIWTGDYPALVEWYRRVFGFETIEELDHPKDTGTLFKVGDNYLWIGEHSEVSGVNKDRYRHMINLEVESVSGVSAELKEKGVVFVADPFPSPVDPSLYFATFEDPEGNLFQLVGEK